MNIDIETVTEAEIHLTEEEQFERRDSLDRPMTVRRVRVRVFSREGIDPQVRLSGYAPARDPQFDGVVSTTNHWNTLDILPQHVLTALSAALEDRVL